MVTQKEALFFRERDAKAHNGAKEEDAPGQSVSRGGFQPRSFFFSTELCGIPLACERKNNDNNNT